LFIWEGRENNLNTFVREKKRKGSRRKKGGL